MSDSTRPTPDGSPPAPTSRPGPSVANPGRAPAAADGHSRPGYGSYGGYGGYGAYASYGQPPERERHLMDFLRVLYRRRWPALTAFVVVVLMVTLSITTGPPVYEARAQVMIESELPNVASFRNMEQQLQYTDEGYLQTQFKIIQSRGVARRTLESAKLWNQPPFGGQPVAAPSARGPRQMLSSVVQGVGAAIRWPFGWAKRLVVATPPPPKDVEKAARDETAAQAQAIDVLLANLTVAPIRNSRLVDVRFRAGDPQLAARVVNALTKEYIQQNLEFRFLSSKDATDWLGGRLAEERKQVETSEQALQRYREQNNSVSLDERQNIVVQKLTELNAAVTHAKTERIQKEALYSQVKAIEHDRAALESLPAILGNSYVQKLKEELRDLQRQQAQLGEKLGEKHPEMKRVQNAIQTADARLQIEISKVVDGLRNDYEAALAQERSLNQALETQKAEALALNRQAIDYGVLQRDAATNRKLFETLLEQTKETDISSDMKTRNIRVVDEAEVPRAPMGPGTQANWLLTLLGGVIAAVSVAMFFEYLDNRVKLPEEIEGALGLPFLGIVPTVPKRGSGFGVPLVNDGVPVGFVEAVRMVRTNLIFASPDGEPPTRTLLVTSAAPGEGKTVIASNVALALAQAGQRVLLIDADMRRPRQHEIFHQEQQPGLSEVLVRKAEPSAAIHKLDQPGLWLLPAGYIPPDPTELLASRKLSQFVSSLLNQYDWVVIDSPPVLPVADASVLANVCSSVLFVVGAEMTSRQAARRAVEQLLNAKAKVTGGVLNRVNVGRHAYYYSHYYGRGYGKYYGPKPATEEKGQNEDAPTGGLNLRG